MPSGKRARQQRQQTVAAPPPVGGVGARQASPKVLGIAGGVIILVIVAIVLGVLLTRNNNSVTTGDGAYDGPKVGLATGTPTVGSSTKTNTIGGPARQAAEVAALLKGIPQDHFALGKPDAPVTLTEYIDLQCPVCDTFETQEFGPLVDKYVRDGKLRIVIQPWSILDKNVGEYDSTRGQKATIAAAAQNKAFNFAQVLYENQGPEGSGWMNDGAISNIAASVDGLKPYQLAKDANSSETQSVIKEISDFAASHPSEMTGTPTLYVYKTGETPKWFYTGDPGLPYIQDAIDKLLKK
jgi:protein-disulfide isomerase